MVGKTNDSYIIMTKGECENWEETLLMLETGMDEVILDRVDNDQVLDYDDNIWEIL